MPTFMPLSRPNFFHMPESRLGLASLMGGLVGGVMGLSVAGLSALPLSSVIPGALPEPDVRRLTSARAAWGSLVGIAAGDDVLAESLTLKRALLIDWEKVEGADFRFMIEGGL